jgi:hypothetical protein
MPKLLTELDDPLLTESGEFLFVEAVTTMILTESGDSLLTEAGESLLIESEVLPPSTRRSNLLLLGVGS